MTPSQDARFYIDCEFDGHNGPLLSIALVEEYGRSVHIEANVAASDPWVLANVVPLMEQHDATDCTRVAPNEVGNMIRWFIGDCERPVIIADSPVDIGRFCQALSTGPDGGWASADYPAMRFEVHNVDCYPTDLPGAVQHNAWWDAMALRHKLAHLRSTGLTSDCEECRGTGVAEMIGGYERPCDACRGEGTSPERTSPAGEVGEMRLLRDLRELVDQGTDPSDRHPFIDDALALIDAALAKGDTT